MKSRLVSLFTLACFASILSGESSHPGPAGIQNLLQSIQKEFAVPGLSAAVVRNEEILTAVAGIKVLGKEGPLTAASRFHIGSVTKPITATLIATVVESGKLSWNTKVVEVFPEWKESIQKEFLPVTLADLLAHQAGVQAFTDDAEFAGLPEFEGTAIDQRRNFALHVLKQKPVAKVQQEFFYSNAGFTVAMAMAEKVTGESWEDGVQKRIFEPLGMKTAGFGWPAKQHAEEPWGHWMNEGKLVPHDPAGEYQLTAIIAPAGDLHMSMEDLARFARFHLQALHGKNGILKADTVKALHTKRVKSGLGWGIQKLLDFEPVSVYAGSAETFLTLIAVAPKQNIAVVVSANGATEQIDQGCKKAFKDLIQMFATK